MRRLPLLLLLALFTFIAPAAAQEDPLTATQPVLDYIRDNPDSVAFLCATPAGETAHNADAPFPLASAFKLLLLAEMGRQMDAGLLNIEEEAPATDVDAWWLPGTDGGAHAQFINYFGTDRQTLTLREIAYGMIRFSSNAAADYLTARLGYDGFPALYDLLDLTNTQPVSGTLLGLYLVLENHETGKAALEAMTDEQFAAESARLQSLFLNDPDWRTFELATLASRSAQAQTADMQTALAEYARQAAYIARFGIQGSPRDLLRVLAAAYGGEVFSAEAQTFMRDTLNWLMDFDRANRNVYAQLGSKGGSWAGVLTGTWYVQPLTGEPLLLAVFYRDLPPALWSEWLSTGTPQLLELRTFAYGEGCGVFPGM
jgi:D-alanyl-D-alanine carboxypeptidase